MEPDETQSLGRDRVEAPLLDVLQMVNNESAGATGAIALDAPRTPDAPVVEYGAAHDRRIPRASLRARVHEPRSVGVGQQRVVVFGQEPRGCRRIGVGVRRVRKIEEFTSTFVVEGPQSGAQPIDDGDQSRTRRWST